MNVNNMVLQQYIAMAHDKPQKDLLKTINHNMFSLCATDVIGTMFLFSVFSFKIIEGGLVTFKKKA